MDVGSHINVLDKGYVELQDVMPNPSTEVTGDMAIVSAARTSYLKWESMPMEQDKKLLFYLMEHHHTSPFEHVIFKFRVKAPLLVWWQWFRHRTWSYNSQSGRYKDFTRDDFYSPREWRKQSESGNKQMSEGLVEPMDNDYHRKKFPNVVDESFRNYELALNHGVAREQARLYLPAFALYYTVVCTVDAHNLMHFLKLRLAKEAQWEIRQYAKAVYQYFEEFLPWTAEAFQQFHLGE